jgi:CubicO group peptidase (beta-lactamase class C family)
MIGDHAVGYSYAIYHHGNVVLTGAHGYAQMPSQTKSDGMKMTPDTPMQIASVSKSITAVALLHALFENGIGVDEFIWPYLKDQFPVAAEPFKQITVRQLLTHKTGYEFGYIESPRFENTQYIVKAGPENPPGEGARYSNINSALARTLLESITRKAYEAYVQEELFDPIGVKSMTTRGDPNTMSDAHDFNDPMTGEHFDIDFSDEVGPYGWYGSVSDLAKFADAVASMRFMPEVETQEMLSGELGWSRVKTHAGDRYGHDGQWIISDAGRGVRAGVAIYPQGVSVAFFVNTNGPYFPRLAIGRAYEEGLPKIVYQINPDTQSDVAYAMTPAFADRVSCTVDGADPAKSSSAKSGPISAAIPVDIRCISFAQGTPAGFETSLSLNGQSEFFQTY